MANKKKSQSLTERINNLANAIGGKAPPDLGKIKGELVNLGVLAEALENSKAIRDAESKITFFEAALKESNAENTDLETKLQTANAEIRAFRAERKKQEEADKKKDIPDIQFEILRGLPTEHIGDGATLKGISRRANIPPDESAIHLDLLEEDGFAKRRIHQIGDVRIVAWCRTIEGDKLVLAKRLAGEEDARTYKHADLPKKQHEALLMIGSDSEGVNENAIANKIGASLLLTRRYLRQLREAEMATDGDDFQATYGTGDLWWLMDKGEEYLAERDLL